MMERLWLVLAALAGGIYLVAAARTVPTGHVGIVERRFGLVGPGEFSVRTGLGAQGPQAVILKPDRRYLRSPLLYKVTYARQTVVPAGTVGAVVALVGAPPAAHQTLCRHVECNLFQDGRAFLLGGGQMGRQPAVLPGGARYDINPLIFDVVTVDNIGEGRHGLTADSLRETSVPVGATGVVIALEGAPADEEDGVVAPVVPGHASFQLPWMFLDGGGRRGAQAETLGQGIYRINPWFARVVLIPTRDLILEWERTSQDKPQDNYDVALEQIRINIEGHRLRFTMTQTIRIPSKAAPVLVGRFGEVRPARPTRA
jgi:hypothetical protein